MSGEPRYLFKVVEEHAAPKVELKLKKMILQVAPEIGGETKHAAVARWYREQINVPPQLEMERAFVR
jgi:hypothetical protein